MSGKYLHSEVLTCSASQYADLRICIDCLNLHIIKTNRSRDYRIYRPHQPLAVCLTHTYGGCMSWFWHGADLRIPIEVRAVKGADYPDHVKEPLSWIQLNQLEEFGGVPYLIP